MFGQQFMEIVNAAQLVPDLADLGLLVTGTRTSRGMMLLGRRRNSSTDSLQALALLCPDGFHLSGPDQQRP